MSESLVDVNERATYPTLIIPSGFFLFDLLDRLLERSHERHRVSQVALSDLEFRDQYAVMVYKHQTITLFHSDSFLMISCRACPDYGSRHAHSVRQVAAARQ
jgi:hypothetical protein